MKRAQDIRQALVTLNMPLLQQPEAYIGNYATLLDSDGKIHNKKTIEFLQSVVDAFIELINKYDA